MNLDPNTMPFKDVEVGDVRRHMRHLEETNLKQALDNLMEAWVESDRLRTTYQLQLEALTLAANRVAAHCRHGNHPKIFQTLVELLGDQQKANQP